VERARRRLGGAALAALVFAACATGDPIAAPDPSTDGGGRPSDGGPIGDVTREDRSGPDVDGGNDDGGGPVRAAFGLDLRPANPSCRFPSRPTGTTPVKLERVYPSLALGMPIVLAQRPGDRSRWYVAQRDGHLEWFSAANPTGRNVAADLGTLAQSVGGCLDKRCVTTYGEGGFLGLAFHPRFSENGRAYVSFTAPQWTTPASTMRSVIAELTSTDGGDTFTGYRTMLLFDNREGNHKGGALAFGPDGYLYATFGDGGSLNDAFAMGQTKDGFYSKVLRLDVDGPRFPGREYGVPADNPFRDGGGEPAVFAWGFRNPFRLSVDRATGDVWVGDVGQSGHEEIDRVELGGNYGWSCREGAHPFHVNPIFCPDPTAGFREPVVEDAHPYPDTGRSIIGGVVYRGKVLGGFTGTYLYADYITQDVSALHFDAAGSPVVTLLNEAGPRADWVSFTEDADGEVYAVALSGAVYALVANGSAPAPSPIPERLSATGCVDPSDPNRPAPGLIPFAPNAAVWNDGADVTRWLALPDGARIERTEPAGADEPLGLPNGSVLLEALARDGKRIETRVLVRDPDGSWAGYSYEWNEAGTDALLLAGGKAKPTGAGQSWSFPSRSECGRCHASGAGGALGFTIGQLNRDLVYPTTNRIANQLATFEHLGLFTEPLPKPPGELPALPEPGALGSPLEGRARAWLHGNCASCHRPAGTGGSIDLRFSTPLGAASACNVEPSRGTLEIAGAKLIAPGDPAKSLVAVRPRRVGANRMPPLATRIVDTAGLGVVDAWITSLAGCP
jgi:uncharacterized repeat protein (TIGR03806 family)